MKNSKLSIAIPTYNRSDILKENLLYIMEDIKKHNIPIYISDDSNNDKTFEIISQLKLKYEYIYYTRNKPSLGHDKNCLSTLSLPDTKYIWYLGDSLAFKKGTIKIVMDIINQYDIPLIFINETARNLTLGSGIYSDKNYIMSKLGWHITQSGVTIYSKKEVLKHQNMNLDKVRNFPQFALIFKILDANPLAYWINNKYIFVNNNKKSYWNDKVFNVFIDDWESVVNEFKNNFSRGSIDDCIKSHSINTKLFGLVSLLKLRAENTYNYKKFREYEHKLEVHSTLPKIVLLFISIIPRNILIFLKRLAKRNNG